MSCHCRLAARHKFGLGFSAPSSDAVGHQIETVTLMLLAAAAGCPSCVAGGRVRAGSVLFDLILILTSPTTCPNTQNRTIRRRALTRIQAVAFERMRASVRARRVTGRALDAAGGASSPLLPLQHLQHQQRRPLSSSSSSTSAASSASSGGGGNDICPTVLIRRQFLLQVHPDFFFSGQHKKVRARSRWGGLVVVDGCSLPPFLAHTHFLQPAP